jgi:GDP/UDP-N,N'-diacetylbacillosamine 2-epimerase (hydrolysing)
MQKVCVVTTYRADWGYLYWLCHDLQANDKFDLQIILPFNHHNFNAIANEFKIYPTNAVKSIKDFGQFYSDCYKIMLDTKPGMVIVLGDRFETLAATTATLLLNIRIFHFYGGEKTTGAFDDEIRNAISMMADIHFTSNYDYSMSLCNMGINGLKVFTVGSTGLDWLHRTKLLSKQELKQHVSIDLNQPFVIACYHPETKNLSNIVFQANNFVGALSKLDEQILLASPNIDPENKIIREVAKEASELFTNIRIVDNIDHLVYLSLLQYASFMIGNSSSGIIESASFSIPSVSVGNRQKGRIRNSNTFDCSCETQAILEAVYRAREWNSLVGKCENVYGDGKSTERIIKILEEI